jgi:hypothetical protein
MGSALDFLFAIGHKAHGNVGNGVSDVAERFLEQLGSGSGISGGLSVGGTERTRCDGGDGWHLPAWWACPHLRGLMEPRRPSSASQPWNKRFAAGGRRSSESVRHGLLRQRERRPRQRAGGPVRLGTRKGLCSGYPHDASRAAFAFIRSQELEILRAKNGRPSFEVEGTHVNSAQPAIEVRTYSEAFGSW